ncbi:MAG TPA: NAD(P)/FAD-dependent oxidoreductase [Puia sp.]|nr:NAD(P)/FAD-dependent oxidoreductase [Puia sp.]
MPSAIIVLGAGAAGLLAARQLSDAGWAVIVLEAAARPGGRINTLYPPLFDGWAEGGAEFIHGSLEWSLRLAKEAGIPVHPVRSGMTRVKKGQWSGNRMITPGWDELMEKMAAVKEDLSLTEFLSRNFPGDPYAGLRESVRGFAQGFDLADLNRASTRALYREWSHDGEDEEYRLEGGYGKLVDHLSAQCRAGGCTIHLSSPVTHVRWERGRVELTTKAGAVFTASKLLITVSLGVLQYPGDSLSSAGSLEFIPAIPEHLQAAGRLGYGSVVKILLAFRAPFWRKRKKRGHTLFIVSDEKVPTWWTQADDENTLLTGWLTGDNMREFQRLPPEEQMNTCISALGSIFALEAAFLREQLAGSRILDWSRAPYVRGGYSFEAVGSVEARHLLSQPVEDTLYFAGEALYEGDSPATVEAAFSSGAVAAQKIIARL